MFFILSITTTVFVACHDKTIKELLTKKWQLVNVYVDNEITDKPDVIKWLKEMNDTIKKSLVVTEYSKNNRFLCYLDNILLNGISADKSLNDYYRLVNDEGFIDDQGNIIMIYYRNKKTKIIKEEILSISENELITKNYDFSFMKMAGDNHLIFVYKSCD